MYYIFVFKSRTEAMNFYEKLKAGRVPSVVVNTPPKAQVGCGLSVKVAPDFLSSAKKTFAGFSANSFLGLFKISCADGRFFADKIT